MYEEQKSNAVIDLPRRRRGPHSDTFCDSKIITNHYYVDLNPIEKINIFSVKYQPMIPFDNTKLRYQIANKLLPEISKNIKKPVISGMNLYSLDNPIQVETQYTYQEYTVSIKKVKTYDVKSNPKLLLAFLNNGLRNIMNNLNYVEIGRSGKYFNSRNKVDIESLMMFSGYKSNFVQLEKGIFLRVDAAKKIVRNQTVLEYIDNLYKIHKQKEKQEKRAILKSELIDKTVMSNYGKTRYYRIVDIHYIDISSYKFDNSDTKLVDYYKDKYKISIKNLKQPLLVAESKIKSSDKPTYLIPELMLMTGIPDDFDQFRRKKVSELTIKQPHDKMKQIGQLMEQLKNVQEIEALQNIGIRLSKKMEKINAKIIPAPFLELGKNNSIDKGKEAFFNLFNKPIFASKHSINLGIIYAKSTDIRSLIDTFEKTSVNLAVQLFINKFQIDNQRINIKDIEAKIGDAYRKDINICCIVIPGNLKNQYKEIKKVSIQKREMITQVLTDAKLRNKNAQSIATKVLLQMIAKRGNTLWISKPTCSFNNTMILGFDTAKIGSKTLMAACATINSTFSSVYSCTGTYDGNQNKFGKMVELLLAAVGAYVTRNTKPPKQIIVFQNSCTGDQVSLYHEFFTQPFLDKIQEVYSQRVNLTVAMINVKTNERFFLEDRGQTKNVNAGTVINRDLVSVNYDFYIVSQQSTRGSTVPNHYKIIFSNSQIEEGFIQQLAFTQCFNYVNWTGSIKVPAILQYAKKCAKFGAEVLEDKEIPQSLASKLYFV